MNVTSLSKVNLFSHAIDASYHNTELYDNEYYTYEGFNLIDVDFRNHKINF